MKAQARTVRGGRTRYGGQPHEGQPLVTYALLGSCVVGWLAQLASGDAVTARLAFVPALAEAEPWRFLTAAFLHSTGFLPHLLFNMVALYQVGPTLEERLGRVRFLTAYLLCAVGGSVGYLLLAQPSDVAWGRSAVGASGAVFGLFALLLVDQRRLGHGSQGLLAILGLNLVLGFTVPSVAWQAHLGGLVTGAALAGVLMYAPAGRRTAVQLVGTVLIMVTLVLLTMLKFASVDLG